MNVKRKIEVFSAGCSVCDETIASIRAIACDSCEVTVLDMHESDIVERARRLGVRSLPAVVVDGKLAECCSGRGVDVAALQKAGLGRPIG